ncbi:MAG: hypothetical protein MR294_04300 [Bacteroidales bacterium]|nr:hypothetical protein [Bacteroidales bacterium]
MEIALLADMVKELILDNEEVALPGLGTFVTEVVPASFSDRGYTINPPYRRLSFRERQGSDDKLAQLYSKANGTDLETSRKIISGFAAGVKDELTKKKVVVFPGLGRLRATKENAFFFIPDEDLEIFPYGFGLQPVSLKTHEETPEEVHDAVEKLSAIVDVPEPEAKVPEPVVKSVPEQEERPIELVSPAPAAPEPPAPAAESTEKTEPEPPASAAESTEKTEPEPPAPAAESTEKTEPEPPASAAESTEKTEPEPPAPAAESTEKTEPEPPASAEETGKTASAAPATPAAPEAQKVRKKDGWMITRIAAACVVGTALLLLVIFIILSRMAPSFTDSLLYTPEELEIINYQYTEK